MTDYLRVNVIYYATVGLQVRSSTTLAKYDSARTQLEVEVTYDLLLAKPAQTEIGCV